MAKDDDTKNYYLSENEEKIKEKIRESSKEINITDSTDLVSVMTSMFESDFMIGVYDSKTHKKISQNEELRYLADIGIERDKKPFSNKIIDDYLSILKNKLNEDISNYDKEEVIALIKENNINFFKYYATAIQPNIFDLYDESARTSYAMKILNYLMELQQVEIEKIGYKDFSELDLEKDTNNFDRYFSIQTLKLIQEDIKEPINQDELDFSSFESISKYIQDLTYTKIMANELEKIEKRLEEEVKSKRVFYKERHNKFLKIKELLQEIKVKYETRINEITIKQDKDRYKSTITKDMYYINSKIHKNLTSVKVNEVQPMEINIGEPVNVLLDIANTSINGISLTRFDTIILNLVFNLYQEGNTKITPELICKEYLGKIPKNIGQKLYQEILTSIRKLIVSRIKIEIKPKTAKSLKINKDEIDRFSRYEYVLPLKEDELIYTNGKKSNCFIFMEEPQYFVFAKVLKHILTVDRNILALDTNSSLTPDRMVLKDILAYELFRIQSTMGTKKENPSFLYDTILNKCDIFIQINKEIEMATDSDTIKRLKDKKKTYIKKHKIIIKEVLEKWKRKGYIENYKEEELKKGKGIKLIGVKSKRNK